MKALGVIALLLAGIGVGMMAQHMLKQRIAALSLFERFLQVLSEQIRYTEMPVADVLRVLAHMPEFSTFILLQETVNRLSSDGEFRAAWRSAATEQCRVWMLSERERSLFLNFTDALGTSDVVGEIRHCEQYSREVRDCLEERKKEACARSSLYVALGVCGGSALALLLL